MNLDPMKWYTTMGMTITNNLFRVDNVTRMMIHYDCDIKKK